MHYVSKCLPWYATGRHECALVYVRTHHRGCSGRTVFFPPAFPQAGRQFCGDQPLGCDQRRGRIFPGGFFVFRAILGSVIANIFVRTVFVAKRLPIFVILAVLLDQFFFPVISEVVKQFIGPIIDADVIRF